MVLLSNAVSSSADIFPRMCRLFCEGLVIDLGGRWKTQWGRLIIRKRKKNPQACFPEQLFSHRTEEEFCNRVPLRVATRGRRDMQNSVQSPVFSASQHVPAVIRWQAPGEVRKV